MFMRVHVCVYVHAHVCVCVCVCAHVCVRVIIYVHYGSPNRCHNCSPKEVGVATIVCSTHHLHVHVPYCPE